jgi:O-antigen ligase
MKLSDPGAIFRAAFYALLPPIAAGGAIALPLLLSGAGLFQLRPSILGKTLRRPPIWLIVLVLFLIWAGVSMLWSSVSGGAQLGRIGALAMVGLLFASAAGAEPTRRLTRAAGVACFAVLALLLGIEAFADMPFIRSAQPDVEPGHLASTLTRGGSVLLALTWGAASALLVEDRPNAARVAVVASAVMTFQFDQWASVAGFVAGLGAYGFAFAAPRMALWVVSFGLGIWTLAAPFVTPLVIANPRLVAALPDSWAHRAEIWTYVCQEIRALPLLGHGFDAARHADGRIPLHPHSASLQIWYELGGVGAAIVAVMLIVSGLAMARALRHERTAAAAAAATLASLGVVANVSYGAWQEWWIAAIFAAGALVAGVYDMPKRSIDFSLNPATKPQP